MKTPLRPNTSKSRPIPPLPRAQAGHQRCPVCGNEFAPTTAGKRGRPQVYDSEACREYAAAMTTFQKWIGPVSQRALPEAWLKIRADLWALTSLRPWNRGVSNQYLKDRREAVKRRP